MRTVRLALVLLVAGCTVSQVFVPPEQAARLNRRLLGERRYLGVSMYVAPFFGDETKVLLSPVRVDQLELITDAAGRPIPPGEPREILPAGTPVELVTVDFPDADAAIRRVPFTPRSLAWAFVRFPARKDLKSPVLVLRPGLKSDTEVEAELERYFRRADPRVALTSFPEPVRAAVARKEGLVGMSPEALEMALGPPLSRTITRDGGVRTEVWRWPGSASATFTDDRVTALTP